MPRTDGKFDPTGEDPALRWLLESEQPAVRRWALLDLLDRSPTDPEVRSAENALARRGWGRAILAEQKPEGFWEPHEPRNVREWINFLRFPVFRSSLWRAMVLADLGLTAKHRPVRRFADRVFRHLLPLSSPANLFREEVCIVGNVARMMTQFGYRDDRRVRMLYAWMVEDQRENGGWNCVQDRPGTLDCWEALGAIAAVPRRARTAAEDRAVARGTEFYLERGLFREGARYAPWFRFHYPVHYYYDVLVGLDVLTRLGVGDDRRLAPSVRLLRSKRRPDGRWTLDRVHPDEAPPRHRSAEVRPLEIEPAGRPSLWITLTARRVLQRVGESN